MHNYIWCPYYLPSFMKCCSVVSDELRWQAASVVNFGKFLSSKGHNSYKIQAIKISWLYAQLHMVSLLPTMFHEILFNSFRGVALTNCVTDRWTDRTKTIHLPTKVGGDIHLQKRSLNGVWHTPNTLPTMVHCQAFCIITRQTFNKRAPPLNHQGRPWVAV